MSSRTLGRSLDPLPGESLNGFLLRLSCRLRLAPVRLARLAGIIRPAATSLSRRLLLDLDAGSLAVFARLTRPEAASLTLLPWADRYPPIARSLRTTGPRPQADGWLFAPGIRYCPRCLAGDGSTVQDELGGCWKLTWQLPVAFACPDHGIPLRQGCPQDHPAADRDRTLLISQVSDSSLHPAQCRQPGSGPAVRGRKRQSCGQRLSQPAVPEAAGITPGALTLQRRMLAMLERSHPAGDEDAAAHFTDLRVITAMLCITWPDSSALAEPAAHALISRHVGERSAGTRQALDWPPTNPLTAAALLTAAAAVLDDPERQAALAQSLRGSRDGRPSSAPWTRIFDRHSQSCSQRLRDVFEPSARAFRRTAGPHSSKAPARTSGYGPEHIPAFLEQPWFEDHLACLECGSAVKSARRIAAATLVQWAAGGSIGDAAHYLGFNPRGGQYAPTSDLARWLAALGPGRFTRALRELALRLDRTRGLVNYQHRRQALRGWALATREWDHIVSRLPPVPGPVQPILDDRKRQESSAFIWARVTQGEPRFAPRPIEASQPESVRKDWIGRRANTWHKLASPGRLVHYAELRNLLIEHSDRLARDIDNTAETNDHGARCRRLVENTAVTDCLAR